MAEAGRSLKPFYFLLGLIAVMGIVLIVRARGSNPAAGLVASSDCQSPPIDAPAPKGVVLGPDSAKVEITEFSDFECPWCARFAILTMPEVRQRLIPTGKVRWRFMNFPLEIHPNSPAAHLAAACAQEQGKFWQMEDALYMNQERWADERNPEGRFLEYARGIGVNADSFRVCMQQRRPWPEIQAEKCEGIRLGVDGTPTFFVNGRKLTMFPAYDDLSRIVDSVTALGAPAPGAAARR
jgi:protein-disulfide isomerase